jgi:hypothetical protein
MCATLLFGAAAISLSAPESKAMMGETVDASAQASHVAMLLRRGARSAGFCTGVVIARRALLTAAHCVGAASDLRVYAPPHSGALLEIARVARHPAYRADAVAARRRSVDLAVIETREDLPGALTPVAWAIDAPAAVGDEFTIAGFGVARDRGASGGGTLQAQRLRLRAPLSSLLLWLVAAQPPGGACEGDSGAPVFDAQNRLVAIVAFAEGAKGARCGALTQAVRVAPWRAFIESALAP